MRILPFMVLSLAACRTSAPTVGAPPSTPSLGGETSETADHGTPVSTPPMVTGAIALEHAPAERVAEILREQLGNPKPPCARPGQRCAFYFTFPQPWTVDTDVTSNSLVITGTLEKVEDVLACAMRLDRNWRALMAIPHRSAR